MSPVRVPCKGRNSLCSGYIPTNGFTFVNSSWNFGGPKMGINLTRTCNSIARHQGSDVLSTIREHKYLLHHRSHCRYHHRSQSAPRVLAQGLPGTYGYKICLNSSPARWSVSSSKENKIRRAWQERAPQNRYAVINREICSRHVVWGPCEHVVCAASQKRLPVAMYHASAFRSRACHRSHVCVFV